MAKILACSANGYGTGLMMKMTLDKVIEICGFKVEEDAFNSIMEGMLYIHFRSRLIPMVCKKLAWHKLYGSLTPQIPERRLQPYFFGQIQIPYFS